MVAFAQVLRTTTVVLALGSLAGAGSRVARANPAGVVPTTGGGPGTLAHVEVDYEADYDTALVTREQVGASGADPLGPLPLQREFTSRQLRHMLTPRLELGIYRNLWISFAAPVVLLQSSELVLAGGAARATSSTFLDGILPANGFDAGSPGTALTSDLVFRGVERAGILELRGGIGVAPMNQATDDTKPTWKIGTELHVPVGKVMKLDAGNPGAENGVSTGVYELRAWTTVDRRYRYFEGWFEAFWQGPIYTPSTTQFQDLGFGSLNVAPAQTAGLGFGVETYIVDNPETGNRVSVDLGTRLTAHFEGRGYSEMWEVFAFAGDAGRQGPLVLDSDPVTPGVQAKNHPGVTNIESYLEIAPRLTVRAKLGEHIKLSALAELDWRSEHVISFGDAGIDLPTCSTGAANCENDDNDAVNGGTAEVNPLHVPRIDLVGHRYHVDDSYGLVIGLEAQLAF